MAKAGAFGRFIGEPWRTPFADVVTPPNVLTTILSFAVPGLPNTKVYRVSKLFVTGPAHSYVELRLNGVVLWKGRSTVAVVDHEEDFTGAEDKAQPGDVLTVHVQHFYTTNLDFSAQLRGHKQ